MLLRAVIMIFVVCSTVLVSELDYVAAAPTERPYQFGFTIEKNQHRQEKKDERGIVMGEFGFITADGIYHVTVYATDEEGKFRILAMRSYPYEEHPKTIDMIVQPKRKAPPPPPSVTTTTRAPISRPSFTVQGCSGCFIKTTDPNKKTDIRPLSKQVGGLSTPAGKAGKKIAEQVLPHVLKDVEKVKASQYTQHKHTQKAKTHTSILSRANFVGQASNLPSGGGTSVKPLQSTFNRANPQTSKPVQSTNTPTSSVANTGKNAGAPSTGTYAQPNGIATPKQATGAAQTVKTNNASGKSKGKGAVGGFGSGNNVAHGGSTGSGGSGGSAGNSGRGGSGVRAIIGDTGDLYRFKYILDYNGHKETGARNGNKEGSFFAIGDDNVERTIEYIANEFGFQPRIRWRKLDTPVQSKENTLKDYEFVWFK